MSTIGSSPQPGFSARPYMKYDSERNTFYVGVRPAYVVGTGADGEKRYVTDGHGSLISLPVKSNRVTVVLEDTIQHLPPDYLEAFKSNRSDVINALEEVTRTSYLYREDRQIGLELGKYCNVKGISLDLSCLGLPSPMSPTETGAYLPLTSAPPVTAEIHTQVSKRSSRRRVSKIEITLPGAVKRRTGELATFKPETVQSFANEISKCLPRVLSEQLAWLDGTTLDKGKRNTAERSIVTLVKAHLDRLQRWGVDDRRVDLAPGGSLYRHESTPITIQLTDGMGDTQLTIVAEHDGTKKSEETATAGGGGGG